MTGWRRRTPPVSRLCAGLVIMVTATPNLMAAEEMVEPPSMELLEFLLEWETEDGQWVDPAELESPGWQETGTEAPPVTGSGEQAHD